MTTGRDRNDQVPGRGRVLNVFSLAGRGTVVVIEIIDGVWQPGVLLVCAKGSYRIQSIESIRGKDLPPTAIALVIDDEHAGEHVDVGEEVGSASARST